MADDTDNASRMTITVPAPKARINLGKPLETDSDKFGYTGMTLQSDVHLFVDVNKLSFFQCGGAQWQSGAMWLQYANADLWISSGSTSTFSADGKVTIAAGAGQGGVTALDHAQQHVAPRFEPFNNLDLHYRVEEAHNGLRALLYSDKWQLAAVKLQADQLTANGVPAGVRPAVPPVDPDPQYPVDGLLEKLWGTLDDLGYSKLERMALLEPLEWKGNFMEMGSWPGASPSSVYPGLRAFDPYPASPFSNPINKAFGFFCQTVNYFHRAADLLAKAVGLVSDNAVVKRITSFITIWGHAQDAANAALNVADLGRWDRQGDRQAHGGGAFGDEAMSFPARLGATKGLTSTAAALESKAAPFDFGGVTDLYFDVVSLKGGPSQRVWLVPAPATLTLSPPATFNTVTVTVTDTTHAATLTVDGATVSYTPGTGWSTPAGFAWSGNTLSRGGAAFAASAGTNCAVADASTAAVTVVVDGTSMSIPVASIGGATAGARATALATAINAGRAGAATASGASVTVTGTLAGPAGSIHVSGSAEALGRVGLSDETYVAGSTMNGADDVAAALAGKGSFAAVSSGGKVQVTHNVTGSTSWLQMSGPLADRIWSPTTDQGKDQDALSNLDTMRSIEWEMAKWPEDLKNLFRPVLQAFRDVMEVYDHIKGIADELFKIAGALPEAPKMLGLFAADGITMGTGGPMLAVSPSITLVAAPKGEPDKRKFVITPVEKFLTEGPEWAGDLKKKWVELLKLEVTDKPTHNAQGSSSGFRIVSGTEIALMSKGGTRVVAVEEAAIEGKTVKLASAAGTTVAAREKQLFLVGETMLLGALAADGKQKATTEITLRAKTKQTLETDTLVAALAADKIDLGAVDNKAIDRKKPRLLIDTGRAVEIGKGDNNGAVAEGVSVASDGAVTVTSTKSVKLTGNGAGLELNALTTVTGDFKVGSAFLVKGDGSAISTPPIPKASLPNPRLSTLPVEYSALMTAAKAIAAAIAASRTAHQQIVKVPMVLGPSIPAQVFAKKAAHRALDAAIQGQRKQLATLKDKWTALRQEAARLGMARADYGASDDDLYDEDEAVFGA